MKRAHPDPTADTAEARVHGIALHVPPGLHDPNFLRALRWKREGKSQRARFDRPYTYERAGSGLKALTIAQSRVGIASTVWDSSIVLARYFEKLGGADYWRGKHIVELGAGCGLAGIAARRIALDGRVAGGAGGAGGNEHGGGGSLVLTDLEEALPLLRENAAANLDGDAGTRAAPLFWSADAAAALKATVNGGRGADALIVADCVYINELAGALAATVAGLLAPFGVAYLGYGRNRSALRPFLEAACGQHGLVAREVRREELDEVYSALDLSVCELRRRAANAADDADDDPPAGSSGGGGGGGQSSAKRAKK